MLFTGKRFVQFENSWKIKSQKLRTKNLPKVQLKFATVSNNSQQTAQPSDYDRRTFGGKWIKMVNDRQIGTPEMITESVTQTVN